MRFGIIIALLLLTPFGLFGQMKKLNQAAKRAGANPVTVHFSDYTTREDIDDWCRKKGYRLLSVKKSKGTKIKFGYSFSGGIESVTIQDNAAYERAIAHQRRQRAIRSARTPRRTQRTSDVTPYVIGIIGAGLLVKGAEELFKGAYSGGSTTSSSSPRIQSSSNSSKPCLEVGNWGQAPLFEPYDLMLKVINNCLDSYKIMKDNDSEYVRVSGGSITGSKKFKNLVEGLSFLNELSVEQGKCNCYDD